LLFLKVLTFSHFVSPQIDDTSEPDSEFYSIEDEESDKQFYNLPSIDLRLDPWKDETEDEIFPTPVDVQTLPLPKPLTLTEELTVSPPPSPSAREEQSTNILSPRAPKQDFDGVQHKALGVRESCIRAIQEVILPACSRLRSIGRSITNPNEARPLASFAKKCKSVLEVLSQDLFVSAKPQPTNVESDDKLVMLRDLVAIVLFEIETMVLDVEFYLKKWNGEKEKIGEIIQIGRAVNQIVQEADAFTFV